MSLVSCFLSSEDVALGLVATTETRVIEEIASLVAARHPIDRKLVFRALWRREQSRSTGLGHGLAIPHARVPGIDQPIILFARTQFPIPFHAPDQKPVSAFFVILVPEHADEQHLQILASVSEMLSSERFRNRLEAATDPAAIHRLFDEGTGAAG